MPLTARIRAAARRANLVFLALLLTALAAFGWQSFVTQTHIHPETLPVAAAHVAGVQLAPTQPAPERPIDCPICHDAAIAGHYLSSGPALLLVPIAAATWLFATAALAPGRRYRSHGWRSRAPPAHA